MPGAPPLLVLVVPAPVGAAAVVGLEEVVVGAVVVHVVQQLLKPEKNINTIVNPL